jgi:hypothetical protein
MDWPQGIVAVGTWALVAATLWLVYGQLSTAKEQRKLQLYLELRKDFDGALVSARKALARQLLDGAPHDDIKETVMNFFEDIGMLLRRDYLDREMIWGTFSFYASNWWRACRDYIAKERERLHDNTLFSDFEDFVEKISKQDVKERQMSRTALEAAPPDIKTFLEDEARL